MSNSEFMENHVRTPEGVAEQIQATFTAEANDPAGTLARHRARQEHVHCLAAGHSDPGEDGPDDHDHCGITGHTDPGED